MQEPKSDNDEELISKINEALNNPGGVNSGRGILDSNSTPSEQEMQNLLQSMNQTQLMQLIGGMSDYGGGNAAAGLLAQLTQATGGGGASTTGTSGEVKTADADSGGSSSSTATTQKSAKPDSSNNTSKSASGATGATGSSSSGGKAVQLEDLQKILSGMQPNAASGKCTWCCVVLYH